MSVNGGTAVRGRFWWGKDGEMSPGRARQEAGAGHQCHQQQSSAQLDCVAEGGDREPFPSTPGALGTVGAAQAPCSALLPMAEHADLSCRLCLCRELGGGGGPGPFPLPSPASPAPPRSDTAGCARRAWTQSGHGTAARGQAVGGWHSVPSVCL